MNQRTLVVGGGIIGLSCAYYLSKAGARVTVIDRGKIGAECSHGNCGLICPSHVLPLAEPGAIHGAMQAMFRRNAAFRIRPQMRCSFWKWMWNFARRCNTSDMLESGRAIQPLLATSLQLYQDWMQVEQLQCEWQKQGLMFVYQKEAGFRAYEKTNQLLGSKFNEAARQLSSSELVDFEPALNHGLAGGWYFEHDAHLRPDRLIAELRSLLEQRGVRFVENCELTSIRGKGRAKSITTSASELLGGPLEADSFVVATGARTPLLAKHLGFEVPIQPGKGYSITVPRPSTCPQVPMIFPDHRVAVTPMDSGLRLGSIMEFAGYDDQIRPERLRLLTDGVAHYLRETPAQEWPEKWFGWRPMTYDSTPVIGRCPGFENVFLATGHNMLGLSMAPATGLLVSQLILGQPTHIDATAYAAERFA